MNETSTEEKIKHAARQVFIQKGMTGARMQEIADLAGINKALLHYYYRSKEQLFNAVFEEVMAGFMPQLFGVLNSEIPLEAKVYQVADKYISLLIAHRDLPLFILNEIQRYPERFAQRMHADRSRFSQLEAQLKEELEAGNIIPIDLETFVINMISLLVFPFASRHLFQNVMNMQDDQFITFVERRKTEIPRFIMNGIKP